MLFKTQPIKLKILLKLIKTKFIYNLYKIFERFLPILTTLVLIWVIYKTYQWNRQVQNKTTIIIVTPTYNRKERLADLTSNNINYRMSQTLMHIFDIHWIVIEDSNKSYASVERILQRSKLIYTYFNVTTIANFPKRGWTQRNMALKYIRKNYRNYARNAVVYFADDDNSYDIRLFDGYIRKVQKIGFWAVGLSGLAIVEAPNVINGVITKWNVLYAPKRKFATDMAGFAVNLKLILNSNASFNKNCINQEPETCFLSQFNLSLKDAESFGFDDNPKDILVWHTQTKISNAKGDNYGYITE